MKESDLPWPELHRPISRSQLVGNIGSINRLKQWLVKWRNSIPRNKAALLVGPPGTGKTATVGAISRDMNAELVEFNASDKRNKGAIETLVWRAATQQTLDGRRRIILLDEVDGLSGTGDRGGVRAIMKILDKAVHPIVMTANDPDNRRLKNLKKKSLVLTFQPISDDEMLTVLKRVLNQHSSSTSKDLLDLIVAKSAGDLRAAISDLETTYDDIETKSALGNRTTRRNVEETLQRLFMATDLQAAKSVVSQSDVSYDDLLLWIEENIHLHLRTANELEEGFEALSLADLYLGRIMRDQNWKLLAYVYDFLSAGVSNSRKQTPFSLVDYTRPEWPLLVWRGNRRQSKKAELASKVAAITNTSEERVQETHLWALEGILKNSPDLKSQYSDWLKVNKGMFR
ncbi:replication factor C large subunit [Candidatus Thorarchaeota archaeon]|nr:MAG: replication factor C large subunit [Candidatus Thorarchaeota archaeon]